MNIRTLACLASLAFLTACGTITPDPQELDTVAISYDGIHANGGVNGVQIQTDSQTETISTDAGTKQATHEVSAVVNHGGVITGLIITPDARKRYNRLIARYGREVYGRDYPEDYGLVELADGTFLTTREAAEMLSVLNQVWKMDGCPVK